MATNNRNYEALLKVTFNFDKTGKATELKIIDIGDVDNVDQFKGIAKDGILPNNKDKEVPT